MLTSTRPAVVSDVLHKTTYQVRCDHPSGEPVNEYGVNLFLYSGPTAAADAEIRKLELAVTSAGNIRVAKQEWRKVRRAGERVDRDVFRWSDVG